MDLPFLPSRTRSFPSKRADNSISVCPDESFQGYVSGHRFRARVRIGDGDHTVIDVSYQAAFSDAEPRAHSVLRLSGAATLQPRPIAIIESVNDIVIEQVASADFPTRWGHFRIYGFRSSAGRDGDERVEEAVALVMGDVKSSPPLVRVHSQCLTGDVFHSLRCDCRQQLELSLSMIADEGAGIVIYEQQEGRGIGLMAKLQAYELQDAGLDTVEANERLGFKADQRDFTLPTEILKALGVTSVRLLSNNPDKVQALEKAGVRVVERVPCEVTPSEYAEEYLKTKKEKLGHLFTSG